MRLTGIILTHNNADTIARAVHSLAPMVDELILMDDHSTDDTVAIVTAIVADVRVVTRQLANDFASQRNAALEHATHDWVLMIDSDEQLSEALTDEIRQTLENPRFEAYISRRDNQAFDRFTVGDSGRPILLKKHLRFKSTIHEYIPDIQIGKLNAPLMHWSWRGVQDFCEDTIRYSAWTAQNWANKGYRHGPAMIVCRSLATFVFVAIKIFIKDGKWRLGWLGMTYALAMASNYFYTGLFYYEANCQQTPDR